MRLKPPLRVLAMVPATVLAMVMAGAASACQPAPLEALAALNALRAQPQACGPAVPALRWHGRLAASAQRFAQELAARDGLSHEGQAAKTLSERMLQAGYALRLAGENLAAGPAELAELLPQWLASKLHCENLMQPAFVDVGLACVSGPGRYQHYWVLHLGLGSDPAQVDRP